MESTRKPKSPSEVSIKRAVNGGFIVRHSFDNSGAGESYRSPEEHAFSDHKKMMAHVHTFTGGGADGGAEAGTGKTPTVAKSPDKEARPAGIAGKPHAAPPTRTTRGAGLD